MKEQPAQMVLVEHYDVVEALSADREDEVAWPAPPGGGQLPNRWLRRRSELPLSWVTQRKLLGTALVARTIESLLSERS